MDGLEYLEHFRYECTEQTVSRFLPNVVTYRAYKELGLAQVRPDLETRLPGLVGVGLQRLYNQQHFDGGWGWWIVDQSDPFLTAYVLLGMVQAERAGFVVDQQVMDKAVDFLQGSLLRPRDVEQHWQANRQAFVWGRRAALFPEQVAAIAGPLEGKPIPQQSLNELIEHRSAHLARYQDARLAERYRQRVEAIQRLGDETLTRSVATQYARLLAPKDEYEVARLLTDSDFLGSVAEQFSGDPQISFNLAPPFLAKTGPDGRPKKIRFGSKWLPVLKVLAKCRTLRGSWLDPFRFSPEKALDHRLLADYEADLDLILAASGRLTEATALAEWPAEVRGYGPVRSAAAEKAAPRREKARKALMT